MKRLIVVAAMLVLMLMAAVTAFAGNGARTSTFA